MKSNFKTRVFLEFAHHVLESSNFWLTTFHFYQDEGDTSFEVRAFTVYDGRVLDKLNCERDFVAAFQYGVLTWVRLLTF